TRGTPPGSRESAFGAPRSFSQHSTASGCRSCSRPHSKARCRAEAMKGPLVPAREVSLLSLALLTGSCGLIAMSCEESRTLHVLDGEVQNLGGASGDTTWTGGVSDPTSGSAGGTGGAFTPVTLIDDFADCNGLITTTAGRSGSWYHFAEPA